MHAKKVGRAKVTAVHTGARILTDEDSRMALVKADAKRVLGPVVQELGPLVKMTKKVSTSIQKAKDGNVVREELAGIKAALERVKQEQPAIAKRKQPPHPLSEPPKNPARIFAHRSLCTRALSKL